VSTYLVATASAETTTAACEYLLERLVDGDEVFVLAVEEPDVDRVADAAFREAQRRLSGVASVRTLRREGDPGQAIVALAREKSVDEIILGPRRDPAPGFQTIGTTARAVLNKVDIPVFVVPRR
jgi:nucleotide-binding universal stress UspA family protein